MLTSESLARLLNAVGELNNMMRGGRDAADGRVPPEVVDVIEDVLDARDAIYRDTK